MSGTGEVSNVISDSLIIGVVVQGGHVTLQVPAQISPAMAGLPGPAAVFTGRDEHVERLLDNLAPLDDGEAGAGGTQAVPVTAVSGLAGVGKTELVVQAAARAVKRSGWFPGGVLFTDLFGYDPMLGLSPERALDGFLRALGLPSEHIPNGLQDRQRLYRSVLAAYAEKGRRVLVVIDNVSSAEQARPLLPTDGATAALVTSRHTLDGLDARLHDLDTLDESASIALLDQTLRHARGDRDARIAEDPAAATSIAHLCAGLPLALRIAAALLTAAPQRPAADLAAALEAEHTRLDKLRRPDRAVRAAFDLSYQLLDTDEARLFRLLPLNPGPDLSTDAAARLAGTDSDRAGELLQHLADAHLVEPQPTWGRWRMHDLVRLYADDHGRADDADQRTAATGRLLDHYVRATEAADTYVDRPAGAVRSPMLPSREHALAWLDTERPNLTAAVALAAATGHADSGIRLAFALADFLNWRRRFDEAIAVASVALDVARTVGDRNGTSRALHNLGIAQRETRQFEEAAASHREAAGILRETGDQQREARALTGLGVALAQARRFDEAVLAHEDARALCERIGDRHGEGMAMNNLGIALREMRRFEEAATAYNGAVVRYREAEDRQREAGALTGYGLALADLGQFEEAITAHRESLAIFGETGDRHAEGMVMNNLGIALRQTGRTDEAIAAYRQAIDIHRTAHDRTREGMGYNNLGKALRQLGQFDQATAAHHQAVTIFRETADRYRTGQALYEFGVTLTEAGRLEQAVTVQEEALTVFQELGDAYGIELTQGKLTELGVTEPRS
ncbi:hypothetical protein Aple_062630 [Acrocarpospora pleiomorpha]|uniref:Uncharacterized protein n=1 Tax=Acrocarpospora pleiomorpha TaxID=90975 RepID=A0A5M3XQ40_9ACTN|nr:tetratricopeptide repeat protein [Acrocarpospora pleiomorpha]GES23364.1 hypothetical protein Aple_062630 [Acrocarpospora pleiomorpha]